MLREATYPPAAVNVLDVSSESMAAFQVFLYGRFWVFTEEQVNEELAQAEYLMSARSVQNRDELANKLKPQFRGRDVILKSYVGDQDAWGLCTQLWYVVNAAEMNLKMNAGGGNLPSRWHRLS